VLPAGPAPTSVVERKSDSGWLHLVSAKRPRTLNRSFPLPNLYPQSLLLRLPAGAILEKVIPRLRPVEAPPASGSRLVSPLQILAREAVPGLELVETRGELLGTTRHCLVRSLLTRAADTDTCNTVVHIFTLRYRASGARSSWFGPEPASHI
jgi:hypothetical protein